jgi:hypothetical protein
MPLPKVRRGNEVAIDFLDHGESSQGPLEFTVYGRVISQDRNHIVVASWVYSDPAKRVKHDDYNVTQFTIVRSAIRAIRFVR